VIQPLGNRTLTKTTFNLTNTADRGTVLASFLKDGELSFSSYNFEEREHIETLVIRPTLLAVLIPLGVITLVLFVFCVSKKYELSLK